MKNLFTLLIFTFCFTTTISAQVEKELVKSIAVETTTGSAMGAVITLPGKATVTEWDNNYIRITTHVKVENMAETIVKQLLSVGRYTVESHLNEKTQVLTVDMPKMAHFVTVKGVDVKEVLTFEISIPRGYEIILKGANTTSSMLGQAM